MGPYQCCKPRHPDLTCSVQANLRLLMSLHFQTMWHYIAICGSILVYYAFIFVYCRIPMTAIGHISSTIYDVVYEVSATGLRSSSTSALYAMLKK